MIVKRTLPVQFPDFAEVYWTLIRKDTENMSNYQLSRLLFLSAVNLVFLKSLLLCVG